ncbi:MAG: YbaY family lipoprotein [Symbiopectobacterium sp.]
MKLWHILGGITLSVVLTGAASAATTVTDSPTAAQNQLAMPAVSGTINLHQQTALPPNAGLTVTVSGLTVTVSDASVSDAPSRALAQKVAWTDGKQAPFILSLLYNPTDVQPNARILQRSGDHR